MFRELLADSYKELLETINSGVAVYEVLNGGLEGKDYKILYFNRAALELENLPLDQVVGKTLADLRPNIDEFGLISVFRGVWESGEPAFFPAKVYVDENYSNWYENRIFRLSGQSIMAVYDDVTEMMVVQEKLKTSDALLREVLNGMKKAIAVYKPVDNGEDFIFVEMNEPAELITNYRIEEVLGKRISALFPAEQSVGLVKNLRKAWISGETVKIPLTKYEDDRVSIWVENTIFRVASGHVVAVFEDTFEQRSAEQALKNSEEKMRRYLENAPDGFFIANTDGRYLRVNKAASLITGYSSAELLSMSIIDLTPEDSHEVLMKNFNEVKEKGRADVELPFIRKDGERRIWNVRAVRLSGNRIMAFKSDVTELRRTQESLRLNESRYRNAQRIGKVGNWEYNLQSGDFWTSEEGRRIYGFEAGSSLFSTEMVEQCIPERERVHQALVDLIEHDKPYDLIFDVIPHGTNTRITISSTADLLRDEHGAPLKVVGMIKDITKSINAEKALKSQEKQYHSLFNSIRDAILVIDTGRIMVDCNQAFLDLFGYSREEITSRSTLDIHADKNQFVGMEENLSSIRGVDEGYLTTLNYKKKNGVVFPGETNIFKRNDQNGNHAGFVGVIRDISDRKALEQQIRQSQKMEAIGQLAGGVAHDFNNLLTIINGYSDILLGDMDENQYGREELLQIKQAGERAASLTGQLLAFSRKQTLQLEVLDVNLLILNTEKLLKRIIGEHIELVTELEPGLPPVKADRTQMEQIIMNLAVNARDAMPHGGKLSIRTAFCSFGCMPGEKRENNQHGTVNLTVSDNGSGMTAEVKEKIFDPFFTTKESGRGTGMGLSTVYGIIKQSGGEITVSSEPYSGSVFSIHFPAEDAEGLMVDSAIEENVRSNRGSETILLVEDEASVRDLIETSFSNYGYNLLCAESGIEAIRIARSTTTPIDLLLTDVIMPGMPGPVVAEAVQKLFPNVAVCYMSGYTSDMIGSQGVLEEGTNFFHKPFLPSELVRKIRDILDSL